jgi:hypothetical protein
LARLERAQLERERERGGGLLLIVFREEDITDAQRRESERSGTPIIILDR